MFPVYEYVTPSISFTSLPSISSTSPSLFRLFLPHSLSLSLSISLLWLLIHFFCSHIDGRKWRLCGKRRVVRQTSTPVDDSPSMSFEIKKPELLTNSLFFLFFYLFSSSFCLFLFFSSMQLPRVHATNVRVTSCILHSIQLSLSSVSPLHLTPFFLFLLFYIYILTVYKIFKKANLEDMYKEGLKIRG